MASSYKFKNKMEAIEFLSILCKVELDSLKASQKFFEDVYDIVEKEEEYKTVVGNVVKKEAEYVSILNSIKEENKKYCVMLNNKKKNCEERCVFIFIFLMFSILAKYSL